MVEKFFCSPTPITITITLWVRPPSPRRRLRFAYSTAIIADMKIFIFEHICGGGLSQIELTTGLIREGGAMLGALVEDALAAGHDVVTTLDPRVSMPQATRLLREDQASTGPRGRLDVLPVHAGQPIHDVFKHAIHGCSAALIVAPEFDNLLYQWQMRIAQMERDGVVNLGSSPAAVHQVSDKSTLGVKLGGNTGLPTSR